MIIPTFNRGHLIARAVASAERQSLQPIEVIIVDDCSTDDTVKKISEISCSIPIVFKQLECNSGGGVARNAGIRLATGDYLAFLDSDDEWDREHLITLARHAFQRDESFVVASSALVSETKRILPKKRFPHAAPPAKKLHFVLSGDLVFQTSTLLMPRSTALQFMFDGRLRRHQDWDLIFRMVGQEVHLMLFPYPTVIYHLGSDRVSRSKSVMPSLRFLALHRRAMNRKSIARFVALEIHRRKASHLTALKSLVRATLVGGLSFREFAFYSLSRLKALLIPK